MRSRPWNSAVSKAPWGDVRDRHLRGEAGAWLWLLLALAILGVIYRRLIAGRMLAMGDLQTYFHPYWSEVVRSLQAGKLPLWNPYLFAGAPLMANSQAGVFYPLNWPLWLIAKRAALGSARALHISGLLHLGLAAVTTYILARRLGLSALAAAFSGLFYAGSGFLGIHVEHINQLQGLAWLPLLLLPNQIGNWGGNEGPVPLGGRVPSPLSLIAWTLILLAGHTQTAFVAALALLVWRGGLLLPRLRMREGILRPVISWLVGFLPFGLGLLAAMIQLLPTLQLARFSTRSGGLPWREAVSFSIAPWSLPRALLPPYLVALDLPEGVAYLGISGLILGALGLWMGLRHRRPREVALALLVGMGVFMALGGYNPLYALAVRLGVPGLVHFRAPARFLALSVIGGVLLIGLGADAFVAWLPSRGWRRYGGLTALWLIGVTELIVAAEFLPHADATAPAAYVDLRPATAFLISASQENGARDRAPGRFLSVSQMLFEVGDKPELDRIYRGVLSEDALWALWISTKQREVLTPNLPMAFGVPAVDGYDGGLLPLQHYGVFSRLLLPDGTLDGRLRENLPGVPDSRWLSLMGVQFLLTDKTGDAWVEGVFYDRQFQPDIQPGQRLEVVSLPPDFDANALGLLYEGSGGQVILILPSGEISRELLPNSTVVDGPGVVRLRWSEPQPVEALSFQAGSSPLNLRGASLIDERTAAFYPLVLSDRFKMAHSGDIKIYEDVQRHSWVTVPERCRIAVSEPEALALMQEPIFDPTTTLILIAPDDGQIVDFCDSIAQTDSSTTSVDRVQYRSGSIKIDVTTSDPALLLIKESWAPGWRAVLRPVKESGDPDPDVRPQNVPVVRGDLLMMTIPVPPGRWRAELSYRPRAIGWGGVLSVVGCLGILSYTLYQDRARCLYDLAFLCDA
jgi:hypothetical protein